jgi:DNA-binding NtrC family response regulator
MGQSPFDPGTETSPFQEFVFTDTTRLVVLHSPDRAARGRAVLLDGAVTVGRSGHATGPLAVADGQMSRSHARFERGPDGAWVEDLGSHNGTFVNGERVDRVSVHSGDVVRTGSTLVLVQRLELDPDQPLGREAPPLLGPSMALQRVRGDIGLIAPRDLTVLLVGETGVGKELVAAAIHEHSGRTGAFVPVNCAGLPENLAESELFGHVSGAFTGASKSHEGLLAAAAGGTLFLDEVEAMSPAIQPKLLRALATGEVRAVGKTSSEHLDVRVVAATNRDLAEMVDLGEFRADLFARLAGWVLRIPPLRDRREDVLPLLEHFLRVEGMRARIGTDAAEALVVHDWPMNVRELEQVARAVAIRATDGKARLRHLPEHIRARVARGDGSAAKPAAAPLEARIDATARPDAAALTEVLTHFGGNIAKVSEFFGRDRKQVYRWIRSHGIDLESHRD